MPIETIRELNAENWPVTPGDLGENITTEGIPYDRFGKQERNKLTEGSGARLRIGDDVEIEITRVCTPCNNLYVLPWIRNGMGSVFLRAMMGRRGWYAKVLSGGSVKIEDTIILV